MVFDLSEAGRSARAELKEIAGRPNTARTNCILSREQGFVRVEFDAEDPDMLSLISAASAPNTDRFLYEEDCVQVAVGMPGKAAPAGFLLANPHGSRTGSGEAERWEVETARHAQGWHLEVRIPIPGDCRCMGLSLFRFFRGVNNEVHGVGESLPHPLDASKFAIVLLRPNADAGAYLQSVVQAREGQTRDTLAAVRRRIAAAQGGSGPRPSLQTAEACAMERSKVEIRPQEGFLCWNEGHFQHALLDLWEITGERQWLEMAIPRMEQVWAMRADRRGVPDSFWRRPLPTWYNDSETGTACTLTSGVILAPIARLMRLLHDEPRLGDLSERVKGWLPLCEEVIGLHDKEWIELPDGSGVYIEPYPKGPRRVYPRGGSRVAPLNRFLWLGRPMLNIARILGRRDWLDKVEKMARYFQRHSETLENGSLVWEYHVGAYPAEGEDISHAHCQVLFAELCSREGIVLTEDDVHKIAVTLEKNIFRYGDVPCGSVRGYGPGLHVAVGVWAPLCRFVPHVFPKIVAVLETALSEGKFDFKRQGWGVRLLTLVEKARGMIPGLPRSP